MAECYLQDSPASLGRGTHLGRLLLRHKAAQVGRLPLEVKAALLSQLLHARIQLIGAAIVQDGDGAHLLAAAKHLQGPTVSNSGNELKWKTDLSGLQSPMPVHWRRSLEATDSKCNHVD